MKAPSLAILKKELKHRSPEELEALCLRLARFKKENKELLVYLLFDVDNEAHYVEEVKEYISEAFTEINTHSFHYIKKSIRRILRVTKRYIRYSSVKETEIELLLHFCKTLIEFKPTIKNNAAMMRLYYNQIKLMERKLEGLHEDLQYDYSQEIAKLPFTEK
ncbi:MAG: hypothetical protein HKN48_14030 [Flavobacteriaceae bacterium]|nr:hypothetical protein [Flavobacteriaceae bacterium]